MLLTIKVQAAADQCNTYTDFQASEAIYQIRVCFDKKAPVMIYIQPAPNGPEFSEAVSTWNRPIQGPNDILIDITTAGFYIQVDEFDQSAMIYDEIKERGSFLDLSPAT